MIIIFYKDLSLILVRHMICGILYKMIKEDSREPEKAEHKKMGNLPCRQGDVGGGGFCE